MALAACNAVPSPSVDELTVQVLTLCGRRLGIASHGQDTSASTGDKDPREMTAAAAAAAADILLRTD